MSSLRGDYFQGLGHIAEGIVSGQVLAQLFGHAEAVVARAWGKMRKALLVTLRDLSGNARLAQLLLEHKAVEVSQQLRLTLIIGAREAAQIDEVLDLGGQATVKVQCAHCHTSCGHWRATCFRALKSTLV